MHVVPLHDSSRHHREEERGDEVASASPATTVDAGAGADAHWSREQQHGSDERKVYVLRGALFFASASQFEHAFQFKDDPAHVELHCHSGQVHDYSGLHALNAVGERYRRVGKEFHIKVFSQRTASVISKASDLAVHFSFDRDEAPLGYDGLELRRALSLRPDTPLFMQRTRQQA